MTEIYNKMSLNSDVMKMHQRILSDGGDNGDETDSIIKALGGIDFILAYFLQQNALNESSLNKIKSILSRKYRLSTELDDILDEIDSTNKEQKEKQKEEQKN